jgi:outer membrane murein-binding lipoprotein Lpp
MTNGLRNTTALVLSICMLAACAKSTKEITPQYVSPMQYNSYKCSQIEQEMQILSHRVAELGGQVDKTASDDSVQMGVGLVLFWPALFFLDGDTPQAAEYSRLRGEFDALEKAAIQKNCKIHIERIEPKKEEPKEKKPAYPSK